MLMLPLPIWVSLIALFFIMSRLDLIDTLLGLDLDICDAAAAAYPCGLMTTFVRDIPMRDSRRRPR